MSTQPFTGREGAVLSDKRRCFSNLDPFMKGNGSGGSLTSLLTRPPNSPPTCAGSLGGSFPDWADSCSRASDMEYISCPYEMPVPRLSIACTQQAMRDLASRAYHCILRVRIQP